MNLKQVYCVITHHDPVYRDEVQTFIYCNRCGTGDLEKGEDYQ
jgi:hypothetical protein